MNKHRRLKLTYDELCMLINALTDYINTDTKSKHGATYIKELLNNIKERIQNIEFEIEENEVDAMSDAEAGRRLTDVLNGFGHYDSAGNFVGDIKNEN